MDFFLKRWFLLLLVVGGLVVAVWPEWLAWTERVAPQVIAMPVLFLGAWSLESRSLFRAALRPWPALWAAVLSFTLVPGLAWSIGLLLPSTDLRIGLLIMAAVPCTLASAEIWTRLAKGNEATTLLVIFLTSGTSWLFTPLILAASAGATIDIDTGLMIRDLVVVLLLPVAAGQLLRLSPALATTATRLKTPIGVVTRLLVLLLILKAAHAMMAKIDDQHAALSLETGLTTAGLCLSVHMLALAAGFWTSRWFRFTPADWSAVGISCSQKSLPMALFIFEGYFADHALAVVPILFYHVGQLLADTFIADSLASDMDKAIMSLEPALKLSHREAP